MTDPALDGVPGLTWNRQGMTGLTGPLLALSDRLEASFQDLAREMGAEPHAFLPLLAADDLRRVDWFASFPHLVTLPATCDPEAHRTFARANGREGEGPLETAGFEPIESVLAPAACYAVYASHRGTALAPKTVTTLGVCFRREVRYQPLRRQWCFRMREVVHLGTPSSVDAFLADARTRVAALARAWGLPFDWQIATDPFFDPSTSPKHLHQKLFPSKHEIVWNGLAIGSLNQHRSYFGEAFDLRADGSPAHSACLAFGVERWLYAIVAVHGPDPAGWPA